jgi:chromosomal replication initiation ATPase DnaA
VSAASQLPIPFEHRPALGAEDFLIAPGNADAVAWLDRWPDWPGHALALHGPAGCGKSHLAQVWLARSGGTCLAASALRGRDVEALAPGATVIEDVDHGVDETALFHLFNLAQEEGGWLLLTGREAPARWPVVLPDLSSRLSAITAVPLGRPDDALIGAVLSKLFEDRQLRVPGDVIAWLVARMERSFAAIGRVVDALDSLSLAERRNITVPLARRVLDGLEQNSLDLGDQ